MPSPSPPPDDRGHGTGGGVVPRRAAGHHRLRARHHAHLLAVREIGEDDITDISRAFALIEDVWPELATEIRGAVFLSEAAQLFSATHYTAEHLLHERSHLRLMLLLAAPTTAPAGRSTAN